MVVPGFGRLGALTTEAVSVGVDAAAREAGAVRATFVQPFYITLWQHKARWPALFWLVVYEMVIVGGAIGIYYGSKDRLPDFSGFGVSSQVVSMLLPLMLAAFVSAGQSVNRECTGAVAAIFSVLSTLDVVYHNQQDDIRKFARELAKDLTGQRPPEASMQEEVRALFTAIAGENPSFNSLDKPFDSVKSIRASKAILDKYSYLPVPYSFIVVLWAMVVFVCWLVIPFNSVDQFGDKTPLFIFTSCFFLTFVMWYGEETVNSVLPGRMHDANERIPLFIAHQLASFEADTFNSAKTTERPATAPRIGPLKAFGLQTSSRR